ncbi:MAG TPA: TraR/DksA C4-type zinc finger protein [Pyrinomonadaceae bacterium]
MYKPNFCCECGEAVARARVRLRASRRFCRACAPRFRRAGLKRALLLASLLFVPGFLLGRLSRPTPTPLVLESGARAVAPLMPAQAQTSPRPAYGPDGTAGERPTEPEESVYVCGARTKKGTPCQRRVRGPGRCWQHRGKPAMLPPSKLVVPG